ncbi:MAG: Trk system potassium transporter TrkA [Candidatus Kapaibacteriales bacterium]
MNILIIGAGDIGTMLARRLSFEKHNITMIEQDAKLVELAAEQLDAIVLHGSGTSYEKLKEARMDTADVVAALSDNDEVNLLACRMAKDLGVKTTIARVRNPEFTLKDETFDSASFGVDFVVQPEMIAAEAFKALIRQDNATDIIEFGEDEIVLFGLSIDSRSSLVDISMIDLGKKFLDLPMRVVAIKRGAVTIVPKGSDLILKGDQVFIVAAPNDVQKVLSRFGKTKRSMKRLMLIGGGQIAKFIAKDLEKNYKIKIIEVSERKARMRAEELSNALVIHGDGSDLDLLMYEGLQEIDEFITVTGNDETNIITSLLAKHLKVPRTITLLRKKEYLALSKTLGLDAVVSKQQMTVNFIQKLVRRQEIAYFAELPGLDAEILEFIAIKGSKICGKKLKDVKFPQSSIIGAVLRNTKGTIPTGDTVVEPNDKVIIVALPEMVSQVEKLFK